MMTLAQAETKLESVQQMSFEFQGAKAAVSSGPEEQKTDVFLKPMLKQGEIARPEYDQDPASVFHRDMHVSQYIPKKVEIKEIEPILTEMVVVSGGHYLRGSNEGARDEMPRHEVQISSFALDIHAVTNEQFVRFLQAMGGEKDSNNNDIIRLRDSRIKRSTGKLQIESGYAKHPVVGVTWYGAVAYAKWVGKRLPTEAEWEVAASGGVEKLYPTGHEIERMLANYFSSDTTSVMSYPPNSFGFYDLAGNVYEWCQDWYAYNYYDSSMLEPENPQGPMQGVYRVLRGGCWKSLKEDLRCSHRHRNNPGAVNGTYGFRCAADVSA
jgi:formylglycine-generating enzyme required for sulfatase activity